MGNHQSRASAAQAPGFGPDFKLALLIATELHGADFRKGTNIPYLSHLFAVCSNVMALGGDEEECIAALLHDSVEDHPDKVTPEDLEIRFCKRVAEIVRMCTDTPPAYRGGDKPDWKVRKSDYLARLQVEPYPACRVSLADKLDNARCIVSDYRRLGEALWERFNVGKADQLWFYRELVNAFTVAGAPAEAVNELDALVREMEAGARPMGRH